MSKSTTLEQLRLSARRAQGYAADVAGAAAEAIEALDGSKADKASFVTFILDAAAWAANTDEESKAAGYAYRYALTMQTATASDGAECIIPPGDLSTASACGMCQTADVTNGIIYFYAATAPSADINIQVRLIPGVTA